MRRRQQTVGQCDGECGKHENATVDGRVLLATCRAAARVRVGGSGGGQGHGRWRCSGENRGVRCGVFGRVVRGVLVGSGRPSDRGARRRDGESLLSVRTVARVRGAEDRRVHSHDPGEQHQHSERPGDAGCAHGLMPVRHGAQSSERHRDTR